MPTDAARDERSTPFSLIASSDGVAVHEYRCSSRRGDAPFTEYHHHTGFALVESGCFVYRQGRDVQPLVPGALLLGNAGDEYVCSHEYGGGDVCLSFAFSAERIDEHTRSRRGRTFTRLSLPSLPRVTALSRLAVAAAHGRSDVGIDEIAHALLEAIQSELDPSTTMASLPSARSHRDRDRAVAAAHFMEAHSEEPLDLGTVARRVGLSPFHFLRTFRRELGITPHQHLIRVRVNRAVELLLETERPIGEIALDVGFEDLSNFVRTFRRHIGWAPSEFRSKILQARR
jgi:AraC-like DNA-binding protein